MEDRTNEPKEDYGARIRAWVTEQIGNPMMGSKKQEAINELEGETEEERRKKISRGIRKVS